MQDSFITAINSEKAALGWFELLTKNMSNIYTPGFREIRGSFHSFLNGIDLNEHGHKQEQTKSVPGVAPENLFLEGNGFFTVRKSNGELLYTRWQRNICNKRRL